MEMNYIYIYIYKTTARGQRTAIITCITLSFRLARVDIDLFYVKDSLTAWSQGSMECFEKGFYAEKEGVDVTFSFKINKIIHVGTVCSLWRRIPTVYVRKILSI